MRSHIPCLFFSRKERAHIVQAIRAAEGGTSAEIRVHVARKAWGDIVACAKAVFEQIGMTRTEHRNGALIYLSLEDRRFAIVGDTGIHEKVPGDFWDRLVREATGHFAGDRFADGVREVVLLLGAELRKQFPQDQSRGNELPDRISYERLWPKKQCR